MNDNKPLTILLVDDDDVAQEAVIRSFKIYNIQFPIVTASDGQEALDILRGLHPDKQIDGPIIVLLDLNMPRMNGFEFLQTLRTDLILSSTVVFVLTTSSADSDRVRAYEEYISGYMVKSAAGPQFGKLAALLSHYQNSVSLP